MTIGMMVPNSGETPAQKDTDLAPPLAVAPAEPEPQALDDAEPLYIDRTPRPKRDAGTWDVMGAAWQAETIKTDAWNYTETKRRDLTARMFDMLPAEAKQRVMDRRWDHENNWIDLQDMVIAELAPLVQSDPTSYAGLPLTREQFDRQIDQARRRELADAEAIKAQPGGGLAEFIGAGARAMTDQTSLMLLPFGLTGGLWRSIASEAGLGLAGEAAIMPREFEVARELDLPTPDIASRLAMGALLGGGLAAGLHGLVKGVERIRAHRAGLTEAKPKGVLGRAFEAGVDKAEAALRGDRTVQEVVGAKPPQDGTLGALVADGPGFATVIEAGSGYTVVAGPDGAAVRREGTRAWRNNNPGNIEYGSFAQSMGAIGTDGRFAVFPTYEAGRNAKATLLFAGKGYRGLTIGQAIARYAPSFENDTGAYTRAITRATGTSADTPMSALTAAQRSMMLDTMERVEGFKVGTENGITARAPRRGMETPMPGDDIPNFATTSRGYTQSGQVTAGEGFRIDVDYEVVDASSLIRASGDMQPRDRSRITSDAWIADTAARLDPAQLMPSPTADRGAPIVGPDNIIESGNGRFGAIERAYARHPDRGMAYRAQIEAAGYPIPEGVQNPVLIARRKTELSPEDRSRFAVDAQDSGVAAMTPTEVARASSRSMTAPVLQTFDPLQPLTHEANGGFVRAVLSALPRSARNAMFDAGGVLNKTGQRQLREALFARAWPDPDILARFAETDAGELKSLLDALDRAAPSWAALKADIEAGLVRPEMDISGHVLDAMRLIGAARDLSAREGLSIGKAIAEMLDEVDLLEGAIAPLTAALVRKFWKGGRAASADDVAGFLTRYADEARKVGGADALFGGPSPRDILRTIDKDGFADLPEDLGNVRGYAQPTPAQPGLLPEQGFETGAASPEAIAADAAIVADILPPVDTPAPAPAKAAPPEPTAALRSDFADLTFDLPDGSSWSAREVLDDLDADAQADAFIQSCAIIPGAAA